jgi:hypothetical protein
MTDISIVIPLYNEEESLPELHDWIVSVMKKMVLPMKSSLWMMAAKIIPGM